MEEGTIQAKDFKSRGTVFIYEFIGIAVITMIWNFSGQDPFVTAFAFFVMY